MLTIDKSMIVRIFTILLLFTFTKALPCFAQTAGVTCFFSTDTVTTGYGQTFLNKAKFTNASAKKVILIKGKITGESIMQVPDTLVVEPGTDRIIPVKLFASAGMFNSGADKQVILSYINAADSSAVKATFSARLNQPENVTVGATESLIYINPANTFTPLKVHCYNKGFSPVMVNLKLTINPSGLLIINPVRQLALKPGEDQVIGFEIGIADKQKNIVEYNAVIEATNGKGVPISSSMVHITVLQSTNREDLSALPYANTLKNAFDVSYVSLGNTFTYYQTRVNGNIALSKTGVLSYRGNFNYYDHLRKYEAYDSWIGFNSNRFSFRLGSIMENLDYPIYGRGVKTSLAFTAHSTMAFYYVQNSYNLFSTINNNAGAQGNVIAASYDYNRNGYAYKTSFLTGSNPIVSTQMRMINSYALLPLSYKQRLELKGGYSYEFTADNTNKAGFSGGAIYSYHAKRMNVNLNNYYSSAYYTGLQRGSNIMDNQVNFYITPKAGIFAHYALLKNKPQYLTDSLPTTGIYNNTIKYELGLNYRFNKWNLTVHPYWLNQNADQNNYFDKAQTSKSIRLGLDMNFSLKGGNQLLLMSDWGYSRSFNGENLQNQYMGVKVNAGYMHSWWGINTFFQRSPYYLSEEVLLASQANKYQSYAVGPNVHVNGMHNRLSVNINPYLSFSSNSVGQAKSVTAQASYNIKGNLQLSGEVFYSSIGSYTNNFQSRVGVRKQFIRTSVPGTKQLELSFFNDVNNDGLRNGNEDILEGLVVTLRQNNGNANASDMTTMSNSKGTVSYINLKEGTYNVVVMKGNGLHLANNMIVDLEKSKKLTVPMIKSIWIKGKVTPLIQEYATSKPLLEGLRIIASNADDKEFSTLTNEDGEFELSLPANVYHVNIALNGQKYHIKNQNQEILAEASFHKPLEFLLEDETRKIVVKQF